MRTGFSRRVIVAAWLLALVYAALVVVATGCAAGHAAHAGAHDGHDSQGAVPHNAFCAWACQSTSEASLVAEPPSLSTGQVALLLAVFPHHESSEISSLPLHTRAPPTMPFVFIG
jgi:hypothetical protein